MTIEDLTSSPLGIQTPVVRPEFYVGLFDRDPEKDGALEPNYPGYHRVPLGGVTMAGDLASNSETIRFPGVPVDHVDWKFDVDYVGVFIGGDSTVIFATARLNRPMRLASWGALGPLIPEFSPGSLMFSLDEQPFITRVTREVKDFFSKMLRKASDG